MALVVDDEADVRGYVKTLLCRHGFQVIEAEDGHRALSVLTEERHCVDLVVSDIYMPGCVDGVMVAETFLRECEHTRVILMSGYSEVASINMESVKNRWLFVPKPFRPQTLLSAVRTVGLSLPTQAETLSATSEP